MPEKWTSRRRFIQMLGMGSALMFRPLYSQVSPGKKLNFVFILVDDLGWSDLGCYGADLHETPNIDRLAKESVRFTQAYAASPVCTPTRASIMTGKHPARLNMTVWRESTLEDPDPQRELFPPRCVSDLPHSEFTIAEALREAGYKTAHIGKWHLGGASHYPETHGFDVNIGGTHWGAPETFFYPYRGDAYFGDYRYVPHLEFGKDGEYLTDRLTDEALRVMEGYRDEPFYLNMAYHTVHSPIEGKPELVEYYREKLRQGLNHKNADYAAMIHSLDQNVGRILDRIDELGLADNTVVMIFSDNGGVANEIRGDFVTSNHPLRSGKGSLYEGGIREPLLVRWPGATTGGSTCEEPVCSTDLYPTMLEVLGIDGDRDQNRHMDGISFASLLRDPGASLERDILFWHYPHYYPTTTPVSAVRKGDWKLLKYYENGRVELYNLRDDLGEENNLASQMPGKAAELQQILHDCLTSVEAQLPTRNP